MSIVNVLAGIPVRDIRNAIAWYGTLLGRAPDSQPMPNLAEWRFEDGGWLQVFLDAERSGRGSVTFADDDLVARHDALVRRGSASPVQEADKTRLIVTADPDGNRLVFATSKDAKANPSTAH